MPTEAVTLDGIDQHEERVAQYEKILRAHAAHEVVDAAEHVVSDAWLRRLDILVTNAAQLMSASTAALAAATTRVSEARTADDQGDSTAVTSALALLAEVERSYARNKALCDEVAAFTEQQHEALTRARCARDARRRVNAACLEAARRATLHPTPPPRP